MPEQDLTTKNRINGNGSAPVIGAVILAAGYSSRMKKFKALLPVDGISAVERVISCARDAGISEIVLVTGYRRELLAPVAEKYGIEEAYNGLFDKGMFSSIQTGTKAIADRVDGFFLMPVDCPVIRPDILKDLCERAAKDVAGGGDRFKVPCYMGKKGHPLFVPSSYAEEIISHGGARGLKGVTEKYEDRLDRIEVESESVILDMDDEEGYKEVCAYAEGGFKETSLSELAEGHRFILVRHGQIKQHREKIFLGQTDVPLSEKGKEQAEAAGKALARENTDTDRIYTSDLSRAFETAMIVAEAAGISNVRKVPGFREMALGEWDGKYISEIKEKYPEAYERRGKDILKFKFGNNSENFYDLRYRVLKTLKAVLKEENALPDRNRDILIVAHKGVIQMIACALTGRNEEDRWPEIENGGYVII